MRPRRSLSLKLSDTRVYEPETRARLGTIAQGRMAEYYQKEVGTLCVINAEQELKGLTLDRCALSPAAAEQIWRI